VIRPVSHKMWVKLQPCNSIVKGRQAGRRAGDVGRRYGDGGPVRPSQDRTATAQEHAAAADGRVR